MFQIHVTTTRPGEKCSDGGEYGYHRLYRRASLYWQLTYHSTADFPMCEINGEFRDCQRCPNGPDCRKHPIELTDEEMAEEINFASYDILKQHLSHNQTLIADMCHHPYNGGACKICWP